MMAKGLPSRRGGAEMWVMGGGSEAPASPRTCCEGLIYEWMVSVIVLF
jgi:hypothetical protein